MIQARGIGESGAVIPFDRAAVREKMEKQWATHFAREIRVLQSCTDAEIKRGYGMTKAELQKDIDRWLEGMIDGEEMAWMDRLVEASDPTINRGIVAPEGYTKKPISGKLRWAVFRRDGYRCILCGSDEDLTADHIIAEVRGGPTALENLQTLCRCCNAKKGCE
jgi:hypothetical protein